MNDKRLILKINSNFHGINLENFQLNFKYKLALKL